MDTLHEHPIPTEVDAQTGLPIGPKMANPSPAALPLRETIDGRYCRLEPLNADQHGAELFAASTPADCASRFMYLGEEPPTSESDLKRWAESASQSDDPLFFVVIDKRTERVAGRQSFLRITPTQQSIEIGNIYWGPDIAGTQVATEANFLFAQHAFETLKYRRYEWKCNALNVPSRRAAVRFGFTYEGLFRRAVIVKGRTRDTAWYAMIDEEWPSLKSAYEFWLSPDNFDGRGRQRTRLSDLTQLALGNMR